MRCLLAYRYELLQQPAVWRLITALTATTALALMSNQAQTNANSVWFHIQPLQLGLSTCFQNLMLAVGTYAYRRHHRSSSPPRLTYHSHLSCSHTSAVSCRYAYKRYLLNYSWRRTYAFGIVGMQAVNLLYLLTVYLNAFKNGWWVVFTQVGLLSRTAC
jgi:hypothetical protein